MEDLKIMEGLVRMASLINMAGPVSRPGNVSRLDKDEQPPMWGGLVSMGVLEA